MTICSDDFNRPKRLKSLLPLAAALQSLTRRNFTQWLADSPTEEKFKIYEVFARK
jgi:hypothetical protein